MEVPNIFKAYDIRGVYPDQLNEELAYKIGLAYAQLLRQDKPGEKLQIVVSRDMRESSPSIKENLAQGIMDGGFDVIDIGLASTPTFYFAVGYYGYDGGVQITASHNPPEYNGVKLVKAGAFPISGDTGINQMKDMIESDSLQTASEVGKLTTQTDILGELIREEVKPIDLSTIKPMKVVADVGNAMSAIDFDALFKQMPQIELIRMNFELDGSFPVHQADPLDEENVRDLKKKVVEEGADLGIATDGDGDRVFFIDEKGEVLRQDVLRGIMAQISLEEHPGATVCYDIRPGKITRDLILEAGGKPSITRVGHSFIKKQMLDEGAVFGGESSGHYYYQYEFGTFDAPISLIARFLKYISDLDKPVSEIFEPYYRYTHSGEINSMVEDKQLVLDRLAETYKDEDISFLDGITVTTDKFWFNVRASNTEPKIRLNLEAVDLETMQQKRDEVLAIIRG